jgi:hypothetical protein
MGDLKAGRANLGEALRIMRTLGDPAAVATALASLGVLSLQEGNDAEAGDHYVESLRIQRALSARGSLSDCLDGLASISARQGRRERALRLAGAAAGIRETIGAIADPCAKRVLEQWLAQEPESLTPPAKHTWDEGQQLPDDEAIALALEEP